MLTGWSETKKKTEARIDALRHEADVLQKIIDLVEGLTLTAPMEPPSEGWFVPSRSGGAGHHIRIYEGGTSCSCEAGKAGRLCWAAKGVSARWSPDMLYHTISFNDYRDLRTYTATRE